MANTVDQYPRCPVCGDHRLKRLAEDRHTLHCRVGCGHAFHESAADWHNETPAQPAIKEPAPHVHEWKWKFNWSCKCGMYSFASFAATPEEIALRAFRPSTPAQLNPEAAAQGLTDDEYRAWQKAVSA